MMNDYKTCFLKGNLKIRGNVRRTVRLALSLRRDAYPLFVSAGNNKDE